MAVSTSTRGYYRSDMPVTFADGRMGTYNVVLTSLATMGRVPATATTSDAIRRWRPRYVLLVGIAGGVADRGVHLGDVLVSDQVVDYEQQKVTADGSQYRFQVHRADQRLLEAARNLADTVWRPLIGKKRPERGRPVRHIGPVATGDKVVAFEPLLAELRRSWPQLVGVEMEAGGVAAAAFQAAATPGFFMVRGVSDLADERKGSATVEGWREYACRVAAAYAVALLRGGPFPPSDGGRTFVSADSFFRRSLDPGRLYNHSWTLVGRDGPLDDLHDFIASAQARVAILPGRGGIGKTKLLHALSDGFDARHSGIALRFARDGVPIGAESRDELPAKPSVIVVDDAHRREDIETLCVIARDSPYPVKLVLATRPHAVGYLRSVLAHGGFDPREVVRLDPLGDLCREDVKVLARQALGDAHAGLAGRLAAATRDCPLVTVVGGRLLAERDIQPQELENDDEFRAAVLDRFHDVLLGKVGIDVDAAICRPLLSLIAAIAPFRPDDERLLATMAEHLGTDRPALVGALGTLEEAGVLARRGYALRLVPDVLADHILHRACLTPQGRATGYARRVFGHFAPICPGAVLENLAELDWRVHRATGREVSVLDDIWRSIAEEFRAASHRQRCLILGILTKVAYYQLGRVLELAETTVRHPAADQQIGANSMWGVEYTHEHVLARLPALLRGVGYTLDYLPRCCDLLWRLGRDDARTTGPNPEHAMRVLDDLAGYDLDKPLRVNEIVLDAVGRWVRAPGAHLHAHSPLDVLDPLLAKASASHHAEGRAFITRPFLVHRENTRSLRERAMRIIENCARSTDVAVAVRVFESVEVALANPMPYYNQPIADDDIERWAPEQLETLDMVARIAAGVAHPLVHLSIGKALAWHTRNGAREAIRRRARGIIAAIPDSFDLRLARALISDHDEWMLEDAGDVMEAYERGQRRREDTMRGVAAEFLARYDDADEGADALDERLHWGSFLQGRMDLVPAPLLIEMARQQPGYAAGLCEAILAEPGRALARHLPTLLSGVRATDPDRAADMVRRAMVGGQPGLARSIAWLYRYTDRLLPSDLPILTGLLDHPDAVAKRDAIAAVRKVDPGRPEQAVALARAVDIGESAEFAEALCEIFDRRHGIALSALSDDDAADLLSKLEPVRTIAGFQVGQFISGAAVYWPCRVVRMLLRRINRDDDSDPAYEAFPYEGLHDGFDAFAEGDAYHDVLHDIRDAALGYRPRVDTPLARLYRQASRGYNEHGLRVLDEWIEAGDPDHLMAVGELLRAAPRSFVFAHEDIVARLLECADEAGEQPYAFMCSVLHGVAIRGARSGVQGQPYPEDIELRRAASEVAARRMTSWPVRRFYSALVKDAEQFITHARIEGEILDAS